MANVSNLPGRTRSYMNIVFNIVLQSPPSFLQYREYTEKRVHDRSSYFFFTQTYWVFDSMMGALMAFPAERAVILKERASGSYHLSAYFLAKTSSDAPVRLILPFLYMCTSFWMAGVDSRFVVFLSTTGCTLLSVMAGEALGLLVGTSIHDLTKAMTVMIVTGLGLMLLGGFYVQDIPSFVSWVKYLSPFKVSRDGGVRFTLFVSLCLVSYARLFTLYCPLRIVCLCRFCAAGLFG